MAKKQLNARIDEKVIEKLDLIVKRETERVREFAKENDLFVSDVSRGDVITKLIEIAFERIGDDEL